MIFLYLIGLVLCEEKRYESYDVSHVKIVQSGNYGAKKDWQKISSMTITRLFSGFRYWRSRAIILKHWASLFFGPEISLFITQKFHLSSSNVILSISLIMIMIQISMIVLSGSVFIGWILTNQRTELNLSKWLSESRLDKLFSIRLLLLQLQKYFSRWPRHRHSGQGHPDGSSRPNVRTDSTDDFVEPWRKRVIAVDMKNEVFAVSAYNVITWHDDRLEWDPKDRDRFSMARIAAIRSPEPDDLFERIMMVLQRLECFMIWFGIQMLYFTILWMNHLAIVTMPT